MRLRFPLICISLASLVSAQPPQPTPPPAPEAPITAPPDKLIFVTMSTTAGDIILEINNEKAPISVANFLKYADHHDYDNTIFHRVIPWFVIQGGGYSPDLAHLKGEPNIKNEWDNGLKNIRGTIAMARDAAPDTATREFYINVADNPRLDTARATTGNAGYAVFGRVISGMEVVDAIRDGVTTTRPDPDPEESLDDLPVAPIAVTAITRLSVADAQAKSAEAKSGRPKWSLWRFDEPLDGAPSGFTAAGAKAEWRIQKPEDPIKPTTPPASLHCKAAGTGESFNILLSEATFKDVSVIVKVHADSGKEDQGGGIIWRAKDASNYYIARWNPMENNFRVYAVKNGARTQLGSVDIKADPKEWHRLRVDHTGDHIIATLDGKTAITLDDSTFTEAGQIGLWTKADASTWFDDLAAVDLQTKSR